VGLGHFVTTFIFYKSTLTPSFETTCHKNATSSNQNSCFLYLLCNWCSLEVCNTIFKWVMCSSLSLE